MPAGIAKVDSANVNSEYNNMLYKPITSSRQLDITPGGGGGALRLTRNAARLSACTFVLLDELAELGETDGAASVLVHVLHNGVDVRLREKEKKRERRARV